YAPDAQPSVQGSSRKAGRVPPPGMLARFGAPGKQSKMPPHKLALPRNHGLPERIRVLSAARASEKFHARFDAKGKQYRYFVWNHTAMNPLRRGTAWHVPRALDLKAMRAAAPLFVGKHDFKSFAANRNYEMETTVRTLTRCDFKKKGPLLMFTIEGDGFLYKMCRGIVGTIVQIGLGKFPASEIKAMLAQKDRRVAGMTAPAHGLVLWKVFYPKTGSSQREEALTKK